MKRFITVVAAALGMGLAPYGTVGTAKVLISEWGVPLGGVGVLLVIAVALLTAACGLLATVLIALEMERRDPLKDDFHRGF